MRTAVSCKCELRGNSIAVLGITTRSYCHYLEERTSASPAPRLKITCASRNSSAPCSIGAPVGRWVSAIYDLAACSDLVSGCTGYNGFWNSTGSQLGSKCLLAACE